MIHSYQTAIVVWAVVIFSFDNLREKKSVPLTKEAGTACSKNPCSTPAANRCPGLQYRKTKSTEHTGSPGYRAFLLLTLCKNDLRKSTDYSEPQFIIIN